MILDEIGQIYKYGTQTFVIGGIASVSAKNGQQQYGIIQ